MALTKLSPGLIEPGSIRISDLDTEITANINFAVEKANIVDNLRSLSTPNSGTSATQISINDRGSLVQLSSGTTVNIPANTFAARDVVTIYNDSSQTLTINASAGLSLRITGTITGTSSRLLPAFTMATIVFLSSSVAIVVGSGVS
jgi:hypothetical protein